VLLRYNWLAGRMEIYDLRDAEGRVFAFEIETTSLGRHGACRVARRIPGARVVRCQRRFAWSNRDDFCEFDLGAVTVIIEEPFGDNSRYWVGPVPPQYVPQIAAVRKTCSRALVCGAGSYEPLAYERCS
jgi:hypothetical protein